MSEYGKFVVCPECSRIAMRVRRSDINPKSVSPLDWVYTCPSCDVYVGCHPGTDMPLGTMANRPLRMMRRKAHIAFDWAWKTGRMTRNQAYCKLAEVLEIPSEEVKEWAHIAMLDEDECRRVITAFNALRPWKMPFR